jgi:hypothetical protein
VVVIMANQEQIDRAFSYHPPRSQGVIDDMTALRYGAKALAEAIDERAPDSREKSVALTKIEEAVMWANAAIVRNQDR